MSKKADKSYMYYLSVLVKIKIKETEEKNTGKFFSFAYFENQTLAKNLRKISDMYNLSEIVSPVLHMFVLTHHVDDFQK